MACLPDPVDPLPCPPGMHASAQPYLLPADLPTFYDFNRVLQLAADQGQPPAVIADLSNALSTPYAFVNTAIRWASGEIDQHCQQGKRYTRQALEKIVRDYLTAPTDEGLAKGASVLRQMVADLAYGWMIGRRGMSAKALAQLCPRYELANATLEKLATGIQVFDIADNINAGVPAVGVLIGKNRYRPSRDNKMFGVWNDRPYGTTGLYGDC